MWELVVLKVSYLELVFCKGKFVRIGSFEGKFVRIGIEVWVTYIYIYNFL